MIRSVAKQIVKESKSITVDTTSYCATVDDERVRSHCSETLMTLLSEISKNLEGSLTAMLIGNMVTKEAKNRPTALQVALGIVAREKHIISLLHDFSVACSYDEVLRFKSSAAHNAIRQSNTKGIFNSKDGLVQVVVDNYDANISSQNGLKSTHALAMLMCQSTRQLYHTEPDVDDIPRITKNDMALPIYSIPVHEYYGSKKPEMQLLPPTCQDSERHSQTVSL